MTISPDADYESLLLRERVLAVEPDEACPGYSVAPHEPLGRIESPGYKKMAAIAKAMGFALEAWFEEYASREPQLDWGLAVALRDETIRDTVREISRLSARERRLVLGIVKQFGDPGEPPSG